MNLRTELQIRSGHVNDWLDHQLHGKRLEDLSQAEVTILCQSAKSAAKIEWGQERKALYLTGLKISAFAGLILTLGIYLNYFILTAAITPLALISLGFCVNAALILTIFKMAIYFIEGEIIIHNKWEKAFLQACQELKNLQNRLSPSLNEQLPEAIGNDALAPYFDSPRYPVDEKRITKVITRMGDWGNLKLGTHCMAMMKYKHKLAHLNSYRFLGYIFSTQTVLKEKMRKAFYRKTNKEDEPYSKIESSFKTDKFVADLAPVIEVLEHALYLPGFCAETGCSQEELLPLLTKDVSDKKAVEKKWREVICFLIEH